jgi:hypothetical protein
MEKSDVDLDVLKKQREIDKLEIDIQNAKALNGIEKFKAWAALLGPIMTAVTVLGTVYLGFLQITEKSVSDEDASWRQVVNSIDETRPGDAPPQHFGTLLKPFLKSERYRTLAIGVTIDELPKLRDAGTFTDLFLAAFPSSDPKNLPTYLDLARRTTDVASTLQVASQKTKIDQEKNSKLDERNIVIRELSLLCEPIAGILRSLDRVTLLNEFAAGSKGVSKLPLNSIYFEGCDLSGIDFSDSDLSSSVFDNVKLDNASFKGVFDASEYLWAGTIWWRAKEFEPNLLRQLLANFKPYQPPKGFELSYQDGRSPTIDLNDWVVNVKRLCEGAKINCTDEEIHVDAPKTN